MKKRTYTRYSLFGFAAMVLFFVFTISIAGAQDYSKKDLNEQLVMATLWYQRSAEMRAISYQAFNMAKLVFDMDLQRGTSRKKRAVVVEIVSDEPVRHRRLRGDRLQRRVRAGQ